MAKLRSLGPVVPMLDTRIARMPERKPDTLYGSVEWKALVAYLIKTRGRQCERPECGRTHCRIFGDHIVELKDGGAPLDAGNVMLLCGSCHTTKTHVAKRLREGRGVGPFGA